ncbi:MAG: hypothetical protein CMF22_11420 [Idiomarinaceae bacterium]|nr:hypothetical protein [Idiomarinaceae bacterium]|tara:strand:+ start:98015 stop:98218 length:204 start_codon:yes stop_codon:yes gene_type:complete
MGTIGAAIYLIITGILAHLFTIPARGKSEEPMTRKEIHVLISKVVITTMLVVGLPISALISIAGAGI